MLIAFTICSNNYLAHAKTLGDSFLMYHPGAKFIIGLVDKLDADFDYTIFKNFEFIPVEELKLNGFDELHAKYNITELNTAVKPSYFHYIFENYSASKLLYIDPDILVTGRFDEVLEILNAKNIIITPHICTPIDDDFMPTDYHTLRGGIFNLGFIALSNYNTVKYFLNWWHDRVVKYGYANFSLSMFYDQLWINYVPAFFDNYYILKHPGYNMANWNLHERYLSEENDTFFVNKNYILKFFHFSSYKYDNPNIICSYLTRFTFEDRPDLIPLFSIYNELLKKNNIEKIKNLKVYYYPELHLVNKKRLGLKSVVSRVGFRLKKTTKVFLTGHD